MRFSSHFVAFVFRVSRFVFRVPCFTLAFVANFFSLRVCASRFTFGVLTMIRSCTRWDFFKMVCKICADVVQRAVQDAVQDGVQDVMQDDWRA